MSGAQANLLQRQIISMEDDELGDDQDSISGKTLFLLYWYQTTASVH